MTRTPEITTERLQKTIRKLKKDKSPVSDDIRVEDIKAYDDETRKMMRQISNEIIKLNEFTFEVWDEMKLKVLRKKKHVKNVDDSRPIYPISTLNKL